MNINSAERYLWIENKIQKDTLHPSILLALQLMLGFAQSGHIIEICTNEEE